ncbi:MAG TPA: thiol-disulfide isomerase [Blastocatellia bacterium]|nr:thiol-disulfide isomerase [Blastocatellia bacterium]
MRRGLTPIFTIILLGVSLILLTKASASNGEPVAKDKSGDGAGSTALTYTRDIAPILYRKCAECHRPGEAAPFSVLSYKDVRPWARSIKEKVSTGEMPPWGADPHTGEWANDRRLSTEQKQKISAWVDQGAPEGDSKNLAPAPEFPDNWSIGKPDVVFQIPEEFTLDASGPDEYQYFDVPTNFTEDKYIQMAEARPGNRKIVHHILVFVVPPGSPTIANLPKEARNSAVTMSLAGTPFYRDGLLIRTRPDQPVYDDASQLPDKLKPFNDVDNFLTAYAPGSNYGAWLPGTAKFVPAHSILRFQIHYSKVAGEVEKDRSMVGFVFAKEAPSRILKTRGIENSFFQIPPQADNHKVTAVWSPKTDVELYALMPHMHYRGKAMQYELTYPDGHSETLLNVPNYSFSWQTAYKPVSPIRVPAGSTLKVTGYFDNSPKNKFNPDPTKAVRFGEPTYDEMMIGFLDYIVDKPKGLRVDPAVFASYEGEYRLDEKRIYTISREGDRYFGQASGPKGKGPKRELFAISEGKFTIPEVEAQITFIRDDKGGVSEFAWDADNGTAHCKKVK